jgi:hypothetical protein
VKTWSRQLSSSKMGRAGCVSGLDSNVGNSFIRRIVRSVVVVAQVITPYHADCKNDINTTAFEREHCSLQFPMIISAVS